MSETPESGWEIVAQEDEGATVIAGLLTLDPGTEYARSELADAAGIPLKTLYLVDTLESLETVGMLERVDDIDSDEEACFVVNDDNPVYQAAAEFDHVFADELAENR